VVSSRDFRPWAGISFGLLTGGYHDDRTAQTHDRGLAARWPFAGHAGGNQNVLAYEVHPSSRDPKPISGLIHSGAILPSLRESAQQLQTLFPAFPGSRRVVNGCVTNRIETFNPVRLEALNSTALFGAGWIDRISAKVIVCNHRRRSVASIAQEIENPANANPIGKRRVLPDGRVEKFSWKAPFSTLDDFVVAACANELGLGNPRMAQAQPLGSKEYESAKPDLGRRQFRALVSFVDTLPRPVQEMPNDPLERNTVSRGEELFHATGCALCHVPKMGGVDGVYSDFLLYSLARPDGGSGYRRPLEHPDRRDLPTAHPEPDEWRTPPLWGVADSAPYFHDGGSPIRSSTPSCATRAPPTV